MALAIFMYVSFFVIGLGLIVGFPDELDELEELLRSNK